MNSFWKIGLGFVLGVTAACFPLRVPYWPAHVDKMGSICFASDQITLAALAFERLGLLHR